MSGPARVPAGTPVGGRFAPSEHGEAAITLDDLEAAAAAAESPPGGEVCPACQGERIVGLEICPTCDGSGIVIG